MNSKARESMRILLVIPPLEYDDSKYVSSEDSAFPMGIGYLASVLEASYHEVVIYDFQLLSSTMQKFRELVYRESFDLIGFSINIFTIKSCVYLAELCRSAQPNTMIVVGGPFVTIYPREILKRTQNVNVEVIGEGELTIVDLVDSIRQRRALSEVMGIVYRDGTGDLVSTPPRPLIEKLDSIPFPAFHLFNMFEYRRPPGMFFKLPIHNMITARGCPYKCVFCDDRVIWKDRCRLRSPENIIEEMRILIDRYSAKEIQFYDDTFTVSSSRVLKLCELIKKNNMKIIWRCASRVDKVSKELLFAMYDAGCRSITYGIESGDDRILKLMNKNTTVEQARQAVRYTKEAGIQAKAFFMMNFPGEDVESTEKTIALSRELDLDFSSFSMTVPLGIQLREIIESNYVLKKKDLDFSKSLFGNEIYFEQPQHLRDRVG